MVNQVHAWMPSRAKGAMLLLLLGACRSAPGCVLGRVAIEPSGHNRCAAEKSGLSGWCWLQCRASLTCLSFAHGRCLFCLNLWLPQPRMLLLLSNPLCLPSMPSRPQECLEPYLSMPQLLCPTCREPVTLHSAMIMGSHLATQDSYINSAPPARDRT